MVIVVSHAGDSHTNVVMQRMAQRGLRAELLDIAHFPQLSSVSFRRRTGAPSEHAIQSLEGRRLCLEDADVVWWRRPQTFQFSPGLGDSGVQAFAHGEFQEAFAGLWLSLDLFWINHPCRDQEAGRKAFQLRLGADLGFEIPDTLITSNPQDALRFVERYGPERTIYKSFSATAQHWRETRVLKPEELALLDNVRFAPVIFQEYIPAEVDLRITVVGDRIFPAAIYSQQTAYRYDFRMDMLTAKVEAAVLPTDIEQKLLELMRRLGLVYGAIDMRRTPDGRHVFLEINPAGQWLFVEERTRQPITEAMISLMASHCRPSSVPAFTAQTNTGP
jgi:glutathione synthase/RimK-type ligase-like ATP-grasp enzyme